LITLCVTIFGAILSVFFTVHIMHTKSKDEAVNALKMAGVRGFNFVMFVVITYQLYMTVNSDQPLDRFAVFAIVWQSLILAVLVSFYFAERVLKVIREIISIQKEQNLMQKESLESSIEMLSNIHQSNPNK